MDNIKNIIESLLFVTDEPLTVDRIKNIVAQAEAKDIRIALDELTADYDNRGGGFYLDLVAGGYQIRTRPEYTQWIKHLIQPKPLRLSKPALETLAIIAYKQPVIRSDVEHIRGVDCGGVLRVLMERKFIRVLGRKEIAGRPLIYATTKKFLEVFDLKDLRDLPTPKEIEELGGSASERQAEEAHENELTPETATESNPATETDSPDQEEAVTLKVLEDPTKSLGAGQDDEEPDDDELDSDFSQESAPMPEAEADFENLEEPTNTAAVEDPPEPLSTGRNDDETAEDKPDRDISQEPAPIPENTEEPETPEPDDKM